MTTLLLRVTDESQALPRRSTSTTGDNNAILGFSAMEGTGGSDSVAVGYNAGSSCGVGLATGSGNVAIGKGAGNSGAASDTGSNNVAIGFGAGFHYPSGRGSNNIALGAGAGGQAGTLGNNNIDIGNTGFPDENNTIRIGADQFQPNPQHTQTYIAGITGQLVGGVNNPVLIDATGKLGTVPPSSRRFKQDIAPLASLSDPLMELKPISFRYRSDPSSLQYGLIAEQVANVMPSLAIMDEQGRPESVRYQDLPVLLLNKVQQQQRSLREQQHQNQALKAQNRSQQQQIDWLMRQARGR
ncbi:MAG: tail fiber domain-containing protein [Solirubrobacterales bacterium]